MNISQYTPPPGRQLREQVHTGFRLQNTTLTDWCRAAGVLRQSAYKALDGTWSGPGATKLKKRLVAESRIDVLLSAREKLAEQDEGHWLDTTEAAGLIAVSKQAVQKAIRRGTWHGIPLQVQQVTGSRAGGAGGNTRYQLLLTPELRAAILAANPAAAERLGG